MIVEISEGCSRRNTRDLERVGTGRQQPFDAPGAAIREREGAAPVEIGMCGRSAPVGAGMAESSPKGPSSPDLEQGFLRAFSDTAMIEAKIVEEEARNTKQLQRFSD
jgi:hypothetical protein